MAISQRRVALITGGNSGIGFATASKLAAKGFHVILASRNQQTSARAIERMSRGQSGRQRRVDPARPGFIRRGAAVRGSVPGEGLSAARLDQQRRRIRRRQASAASPTMFELTLATIHLGHFLLTNCCSANLTILAAARRRCHSQLHIPGYAGDRRIRLRQPEGRKYYNANVFIQLQAGYMWFTYGAASANSRSATSPASSGGDRRRWLDRSVHVRASPGRRRCTVRRTGSASYLTRRSSA